MSMDFWNNLRGFLGLPKRNDVPSNFQDDRSAYLRDDNEITRFFPNEREEAFSFNIFSNPLEMHQYFEKQMNEMLKSFGFHDENSHVPFHGSESSFFDFGFPSDGQHKYNPDPSQVPESNLRDYYLKPGYDHQHQNNLNKADSDVDGKVDVSDLDTIFSNKNLQVQQPKAQPQIHLYKQSVFSKTIRNADGSTETQRTVRDNEGNEETTTTRKLGDKEHTVVTRITKDGKKEITENFINCDEKSLGIADIPPEKKHPNWFPFDKYFK